MSFSISQNDGQGRWSVKQDDAGTERVELETHNGQQGQAVYIIRMKPELPSQKWCSVIAA